MTAPIIENNYTGDGSTVLFSFTFEYIEATDIEVSVDNVTVATTEYALANSTTIEFVTAPAVGAAIRIYRNTTVNDPKATFFPGSAIRAQDLNDNFEQILFVTQEADAISERAEAAADQAQIATAAAQAASASATAAANQAQSQVNAAQAAAAAAAADANTATTDAASAISTANSANTTALQASVDAANAGVSATAAAASAAAAQTSATSAQTAAANAQAQANSASSSAATAASDASNAQTQAQLASTQATAAAGSAATASTDAANAVSTANTASSDASTALTAANNAVSTANAASSTATTADTNATAAVATANTASTNASNAVTTANTAANTASSALSTANAAQTDATAAVNTANTASTNASTAVSTANTAATDAAAAVSTANTAASDAATAVSDSASAVSTANTAATNASTALSTANTAATNASTAVTNAATAQTTANGAVSTANAASTTATNAASLAQTTANAVADAYLFEVVAAVANIPSSPSDGDAVRVSNSTGIENSSVVQNVPSGFTGDSGINVEIIYSSSASKWNYIAYNANDPDDRYGYPPYVDITRQNTVDAATLSGRPLNSTHLGTFTGSTITDNSTIKTALQELETEVETKADLVGGVVPTSQLPALAITTFLGTVANQTAMLALSGQRGDFAIRSDTSTTFVLTSDGGSNLSDWQELETPTIPIASVNGQTGTVVLGPSDVGALSTGGGTLTGNVKANDNVKITAGTSNDLQIYHDGSHSRIVDAGTGNLITQTNRFSVHSADNSEVLIDAVENSHVKLYNNGAEKLATKSDGIDVTGEVQCDSLDVDGDINLDGGAITFSASANTLDFADSVRLNFGNGDDLRIFHDGTHSYIHENGTGNLKILSDSLVVKNAADTEIMLQATQNGSVDLYYDNGKKLDTVSGGVRIHGFLSMQGSGGNIFLPDSAEIKVGSNQDLRIYHDGTNSHINNVQGDLYVQTTNPGDDVIIQAHDDVFIKPRSGENGIQVIGDGAVKLAYNNDFKLETKSDGVDITGELQCDSLDVDGTGDFSHRVMFNNCATNNHDTIANAAGNLGGLEVFNSGSGNDAFMAFHAGGDFACYFGLDADINDIAVGGWSMGHNKYRIWHQNNDGSGSGLDADTVDGLQASSFLRSDAADNCAHDITFDGGAGAVTIANNSDIRFQTGTWTGEVPSNTAKIQYHSNHLYFQSNSQWIFRNAGGANRVTIDTSGNLTAVGNVTAYSDIRLKKDIEVIPHALDKVLSLRGVTYTDIESDDRRTGVIAQEVQAVLPEAVREGEEYLSVAYGNLVGVLIESIKELEARVRELEGH